jgi:hypothetical protein
VIPAGTSRYTTTTAPGVGGINLSRVECALAGGGILAGRTTDYRFEGATGLGLVNTIQEGGLGLGIMG